MFAVLPISFRKALTIVRAMKSERTTAVKSRAMPPVMLSVCDANGGWMSRVRRACGIRLKARLWVQKSAIEIPALTLEISARQKGMTNVCHFRLRDSPQNDGELSARIDRDVRQLADTPVDTGPELSLTGFKSGKAPISVCGVLVTYLSAAWSFPGGR